MSARLKAALAGCGRMGVFTSERVRQSVHPGLLPRSHAEAMLSLKEYHLAALCDPDPERLRQAGTLCGVDRLYADFDRMLEQERPQVLALATRSRGRAGMIVRACRAGCRGIHTEKPVGQSLAEVDLALAAAAEHGVLMNYGATRRYMEAYRLAREIARSGEIGDLLQVVLAMGRKALLWSHPHSVDLIHFFCGPGPALHVQAECSLPQGLTPEPLLLDGDPVVEWAALRFANGLSGIITAADGHDVLLAGTLGTVSVLADGREVLVARRGRREVPYHDELRRPEARARLSSTQHAFAELAAGLLRNEPLSLRPEEIHDAHASLFALAWSGLHQGARVRPGDPPPDFRVTGKQQGLDA